MDTTDKCKAAHRLVLAAGDLLQEVGHALALGAVEAHVRKVLRHLGHRAMVHQVALAAGADAGFGVGLLSSELLQALILGQDGIETPQKN